MKKTVLFAIFTLFISSFSFSQGNLKDITILHWNDFHGRNLPYKVSKKVDGEEIQYFVGGTAGMLGYLNKYRNNNSLVVNGGDDYQGTPISSITKGFSQIHLLNLYNLDAFVLGNHEFDYGQYLLDSALQTANFDYLSGNVFFEPKEFTMGKPYTIKEINGVKIGIIGLTALELPELSLPSNIDMIDMLNADSIVADAIPKLKSEGCNMIMLLTHIGLDHDKEMAEKFYPDLDVIVGGHSHTPLFEPVIQNGVIIVQAGSYGRWLGKLDLQVDIDKDTVLFFAGELVETVLDSAIMDGSAQIEVDRLLGDIDDELHEVLGELKTPWERKSAVESNLGQWEADVFRNKTGSDIGFINSGGLRSDLFAGNITVNDIWTINPFGNTVVKIKVSGKVLKEMMSNAISKNYRELKESGYTDMVITSGLEIEFDSKAIMNNEPEFIKVFMINGKELDENKEYVIATNNYVGQQFEKFFGTVSERPGIDDTNIIDRDLLIDAVKEQKVINSNIEKRIKDINKQE
ncbi:MAG: bifunctional metallophosphatase/5'-nucleotidase [Ignavibacteriae bacterium]|nr:bifunctional metallophosphatase/5'-nucleotidase [Ignavibacteriota bacterium]MCB9244684.1 bifunctional metallophosphatase/5'-nucleotidase [Ignavibacteriales bacterium]